MTDGNPLFFSSPWYVIICALVIFGCLLLIRRVQGANAAPAVWEGEVTSSQLVTVEQEFTGSDNGQPLPAVHATRVQLDSGSTVLVDGDVTGICAVGNYVRITRRAGSGPFSVANLSNGASAK